MLTSDPIYYKPLKPKITILNYNNSSTFYAFDPFTGTVTTGATFVFPISCNVQLSQSGHGSFTIQLEDQNEVLNRDNITVGSRIKIECGKQSSQMTKLISGIVRIPGFDRGKNNKVIYKLSGPSTGIRLNERVGYWVSEAAKLVTGQIDINDATRKADTLLETTLAFLNSEGVITTGGTLATDSDVETFIADVSIEYGEAQDFVNFIEELSGGEVIIDVNDFIRFRNMIKSDVGGRGFTIKNEPPNISLKNDDADDTMYLRGGNWNTDWNYNKDAGFANRILGILSSEPIPANREDMGFTTGGNSDTVVEGQFEFCQKFRPPHNHFLPGDLIIVAGENMQDFPGAGTPEPWITRFRIAGPDVSNTPNSLPVLCNIDFQSSNFSTPLFVGDTKSFVLISEQIFFNSSNTQIDSFNLDTTKDYWLIASNDNVPPSGGSNNAGAFEWGINVPPGIPVGTTALHSSNYSTNSNAGSSWTVQSGKTYCYAMPRRRSISFMMWDPKSMRAIAPGSGAGTGLFIDTVITDMAANIKNKESVYSYLSQKLYDAVLPRTQFGMPIVTAPNIPVFPNDPIIISDKVLGFSTYGGQAIITSLGDINYNWAIGNYQAPTLLSINPIGVPSGYRG